MGSAIFYVLLGSLFTYLAINNDGQGIWTFRTLLPAAIAAFDFGMAIKFFRMHFRLKNENENK